MIIVFYRLGGVCVEKIKETKKKVLSSIEKAKLFKQQRLYGGKIPRMTSKYKLARRFVETVVQELCLLKKKWFACNSFDNIKMINDL